MIIRNLTKKYMVIRELLSDDEVREYICYELGTPESTQYCAVCQNLSDVNNKEIRFLMEQLNNEKFSDLTDFFISNNCLYILFKYNSANDLKNKIMSEKCDLSERLEIVKNILERILILDLPHYFFNSAMDINLIKITKANEIYFTYDCRDIAEFDLIDFKYGAKSLAYVIEFIFYNEIKQRSMPELFAFVYNLKHDEIKSYLEIYEKYSSIYETYFGKIQEELVPYSIEFRIWDIIKKFGSYLKKLVQPALILLALGYLAVSVMGLMAEPGFNENFKTIGTVTVSDLQEENAAGNNSDEENTDKAQSEDEKTKDTDMSGVE